MSQSVFIFSMDVFSSVIPKDLMPYIELIATDIDFYLAKPYAGEIRGKPF